MASYTAALTDSVDTDAAGARSGSIGWLCLEYRRSLVFRQKAKKTQAQYLQTMRMLEDSMADFPISALTRSKLVQLRNKLGERSPSSANGFVRSFSAILSWGMQQHDSIVKTNPAAGITALKIGPKRAAWGERHIDIFRASYGWNTPERLAFELGLHTAQRAGDIANMTWDDVDFERSEIQVAQQKKSGFLVNVPINDKFTKILKTIHDKRRGRPSRIVIGVSGRAVGPDRLKHMMSDAIRAIGLPDNLKFHGLRATAGARLIEAGCDHEKIAAVTGHETLEMAKNTCLTHWRATKLGR